MSINNSAWCNKERLKWFRGLLGITLILSSSLCSLPCKQSLLKFTMHHKQNCPWFTWKNQLQAVANLSPQRLSFTSRAWLLLGKEPTATQAIPFHQYSMVQLCKSFKRQSKNHKIVFSYLASLIASKAFLLTLFPVNYVTTIYIIYPH